MGKGKPEPPLYYDVPIKIEETIEPIDEVRTIYVPIENAINVPESVSLGSFGFNKINSPAAAALKLTVSDINNIIHRFRNDFLHLNQFSCLSGR